MTRKFRETMLRDLSASFEETFLTKHSVRLLCAMNHNYIEITNNYVVTLQYFLLKNPVTLFTNLQDSFHVFKDNLIRILCRLIIVYLDSEIIKII